MSWSCGLSVKVLKVISYSVRVKRREMEKETEKSEGPWFMDHKTQPIKKGAYGLLFFIG